MLDSKVLLRQDAAREILYRQTLEELAPFCAKEKFHLLILGGVALWEREYLVVGQRRVHDIDLLLPPEEEKNFQDFLRNRGFVQDVEQNMIWTRDSVEIDLHRHAINNERGEAFDCLFHFDIRELWQRGEGLPCCPLEPYRRPSQEDLWQLLALHAIKHEFDRLDLIYDLHLLLKKHRPQSFLGRKLWGCVAPALRSLSLDTPLPETVETGGLGEKILLPRERRPFLAGLRLMASVGEDPRRFWWRLFRGNRGVFREAGFLRRYIRILRRL
jgi:hypothetical protein